MANRKNESPGYDDESQRAWRKEVGVPFRTPRIDEEEIKKMLKDLKPPKVSMREHSKTTDIVIRFNCSSKQLAPDTRKRHFPDGMMLRMVFDEVLSEKAGKGRSRFDSELSTLGYRAYCESWAHLFEILYLNRFHPDANPTKWLTEFRSTFRRGTGRRRRDDTIVIRKRFGVLLKQCEKLQSSVADVAVRLGIEGAAKAAAGMQIKKTLQRQILTIPRGVSILGGEAFSLIPYVTEKKIPSVDNLGSWTPRQLAIALLAIETDLAYQTVEKRLAKPRTAPRQPQ